MSNHPNRQPTGSDDHRELFLSAYRGKRVMVHDTGETGEIVDAIPHRSGLKPLKLVIAVGAERRTYAARELQLID